MPSMIDFGMAALGEKQALWQLGDPTDRTDMA